MTRNERDSWVISIENTADEVAETLGNTVVNSVFEYHGAKNVYDLPPSSYGDVLGDLMMMANE